MLDADGLASEDLTEIDFLSVEADSAAGRDAFTDNGVLREDGRMVHSMFLFEVKKPEGSKGPWDYYKVLAEVPGDQAFRPLKEGGCPLIK